MVTVGLRRGAGTAVLVKVGSGERVSVAPHRLVRLIARYERVRLRIEDPGLLLENPVQVLLNGDRSPLSVVIVGSLHFALDDPLDAAGLRWLVNGCRAGVLGHICRHDDHVVASSWSPR